MHVPRRPSHRRRPSVSVLQVRRRSGRLETSWSLLQVPPRYGRLSGAAWESPTGAQTVMVLSQTVLSLSLLLVPRRCGRLSGTIREFPEKLLWSWHRRRFFGSLLLVPRMCRRLSGTVWESSTGAQKIMTLSQTVSCWHRRRPSLNLLQVLQRSWHRRRQSGSVLQVSRRSKRLSGTVWESPAAVPTVLAPSQTVWECSAGVPTV
ncbi:hypothetical protein DPMN_118124 [Dreissena polymorpha]|uniref:Uncharacterized protein n=1 Tax=Dreissena polymorpha TaxID=45954 RepID=A0A9D4JLD6_DREPO|nr:hypothetical protein DPMN_118124 [Dreissena polymorpha]